MQASDIFGTKSKWWKKFLRYWRLVVHKPSYFLLQGGRGVSIVGWGIKRGLQGDILGGVGYGLPSLITCITDAPGQRIQGQRAGLLCWKQNTTLVFWKVLKTEHNTSVLESVENRTQHLCFGKCWKLNTTLVFWKVLKNEHSAMYSTLVFWKLKEANKKPWRRTTLGEPSIQLRLD